MAVITVSRQLGSHGGRVARALAGELGYDFVDKALINKVIRQYGLTRLDTIYDHKPKLRELFNNDSTATIQMMNETIAAFAARGKVVILGRGGFRVLQGMADVLNVFVKASDEVRAQRIAKRDGVDAGEAGDLIKADDELRSRFVRMFYSTGWADESNFDLVVDTTDTSDEAAVARLAEAARTLPASGERTAATLDVDPVLAKAVEKVLARRVAKTS
jgi:cytidylate kinase